MPTEDPCCDRQAIGNVLNAVLGGFCQNMSALSRWTAIEAEKLGVPFKGELEARPERAQILKFHQDAKLKLNWPAIDADVDKIGAVTGMYSVPSEWVMGIEGEHGDLCVRLVDVMQHRLEGVLQYLADKRQVPEVP